MINTSLSLFYKVLVFIEDEEKATVDDLRWLGHQRSVLGALGRLENLGIVERINAEGDDYFNLTDKGDQTLAEILDYVSQPKGEWDQKWRIILFEVAQTDRVMRQAMRMKLLDLGARMVQSSAWITPHAHIVDKFTQNFTHPKQKKSVHIFEASPLNGEINVTRLWQLNRLQHDYVRFSKLFQSQIKRIKKGPRPSFAAKCLILHLGLISRQDPNLPQAMMPEKWIGYQARNWYEQLRTYCREN